MRYVYLFATLDTKGLEALLVRDMLLSLGVAVRVVDCGCQGTPYFAADITRAGLFVAGGVTHDVLLARGDRGDAVMAAAASAEVIARKAFANNELAGVLGLGGSAGTTIGTAAMRALPIGVPKVMLSTLASGQVRPYVGDKDILMLNSVVDIAGINRISRQVLGNAAAAMAGMVQHPTSAADDDKPLIAATMFGVTTPCVLKAKEHLEAAGYEVLVFHATGSGGRAMESLIRDGQIAGVLDITTTELADELVGGILSAGPDRLTAAAQCGIPQVVSVGALDMVNFGPRESVPEKFAARKLHVHNANVTLMRTTAAENMRLGEELGRKVSASTAPAAILLPLHGVSAIDKAGQAFDDAVARSALFEAIGSTRGNAELVKLPQHINDADFALAAAEKLLQLMRQTSPVAK